MKELRILFPDDVAAALFDVALYQYRTPEDQAVFLVREALRVKGAFPLEGSPWHGGQGDPVRVYSVPIDDEAS